jgi:CBS domain-containing protein
MKVESLMTRNTQVCTPTQSLADAARLMWHEDCGALPIVDSELHVLGMVTDRDVCMAAYVNGLPLSEMTVGSTMTGQLVVCGPDDTIGDVEQIMGAAQVRRVPVMDDERHLLGIISLNDIALEAARVASDGTHDLSLVDVALTLSEIGRHPRTDTGT